MGVLKSRLSISVEKYQPNNHGVSQVDRAHAFRARHFALKRTNGIEEISRYSDFDH